MPRTVVHVTPIAVVTALTVHALPACRADGERTRLAAHGAKQPLRFPVNPLRPWFFARIEAVEANGAVHCDPDGSTFLVDDKTGTIVPFVSL